MYKWDLTKNCLFLIVLICSACTSTQAIDNTSLSNTPTSSALTASYTPSSTITPTSTSTSSNEFQCIASYETYAFSAIHWEGHFDAGKVLPLPPWRYEAPLPDIHTNSEVEYLTSRIEGIRNIGDQNEFWVSRFLWERSSRMTNQLYIFWTDTKEWEFVSREVEDKGETVEEIWIAEDNTVWGLTLANHTYFQNTGRFISKFNDATRRFEYVGGIRGIFLPNQSVVFDEKESIFWFFSENDAIRRYDPYTQEVAEFAGLGDFNVSYAVMSPNGAIYLRQPFFDRALRNDEIIQLKPETGELIPIEIPDEPFPSAGRLFADKNEKLWIGTFGYKDLKGDWNLLHPIPQDYFDYMNSFSEWNSAYILLESSNGYIWFWRELGREADGMAWYNPNTGEGCWFTTEAARTIVEDDNQVLWMVIGNSLYSLDLSKIPNDFDLFQ